MNDRVKMKTATTKRYNREKNHVGGVAMTKPELARYADDLNAKLSRVLDLDRMGALVVQALAQIPLDLEASDYNAIEHSLQTAAKAIARAKRGGR